MGKIGLGAIVLALPLTSPQITVSDHQGGEFWRRSKNREEVSQ
ncbi:MAG: hypothetical protein V7K18_10585 [Nostoc sp.]